MAFEWLALMKLQQSPRGHSCSETPEKPTRLSCTAAAVLARSVARIRRRNSISNSWSTSKVNLAMYSSQLTLGDAWLTKRSFFAVW